MKRIASCGGPLPHVRSSPPKPEFRLPRSSSAASLDTYGIDSVMIVRLTDELEKTFGPLPKTLFFEHRTLDAVLDLFPRASCAIGLRDAVTGKAAAATRPLIAAPQKPEPRREPDLHSPIAIVGLAGRYPGARDLEAFWDNLAAGRDCITEVPLDRWDHTRVSGLERGAAAQNGAASSTASTSSIRCSSTSRRAKRRSWIRRSGCSCSAPRRRSRTPATRATPALARAGEVGVFVGVMYEEYQLYGAERTAQGEAARALRQSGLHRQPRLVRSQLPRAEHGGGHACARRR